MYAWVINLDFRIDRYTKMIQRFKNLPFKLLRFSAIGSNSDDYIPTENVTMVWNTSLNSLFDKRYRSHEIRQMSFSERGCAMSHVVLWKRIFNNAMSYGIIFEDDISVSNNINSLIISYLNNLPNDWDIFYLDYTLGYPSTKISNMYPEIHKIIYAWSTAAYIMSYNGAKKILNELPVD